MPQTVRLHAEPHGLQRGFVLLEHEDAALPARGGNEHAVEEVARERLASNHERRAVGRHVGKVRGRGGDSKPLEFLRREALRIVDQQVLHRRRGHRRARVERERVALRDAIRETELRRKRVAARAPRQRERNRHVRAPARRNRDRAAQRRTRGSASLPGGSRSRATVNQLARPRHFLRHAAVVEDHERLLHGLARPIMVALVGEHAVTADERAIRHVPAHEHLAHARTRIRTGVARTRVPAVIHEDVRHDAGALQTFPPCGVLAPAGRRARAHVERLLVPWQHGGDPPGAVAAPVVRHVERLHALVVVRERAERLVELAPEERLSLRPEVLLVPQRLHGLGRVALVRDIAAQGGRELARPEALVAGAAPDEQRTAVARPAGDVRHAPLHEEERLHALTRPVLEPVTALLHGRPVEVDVHGVEIVEVAALVVVDRARAVERPRDRGREACLVAVPERPLLRLRRVVDPVDPQRVHVAAVPRAVVVHRVGNHARVVARAAHAPLRERAVARRRRGVVELHPEVADVRE